MDDLIDLNEYPALPASVCNDFAMNGVGPTIRDAIAGRLLVATPQIDTPDFRRTVIFMVEHGEGGSMGVVLNRPGPMAATVQLACVGIENHDADVVFIGGPVGQGEADYLYLASTFADPLPTGFEPVTSRFMSPRVCTLRPQPPHPSRQSAQFVAAIRVFDGYCGWAARQLETEIMLGGWLVVDADVADLFTPDSESLWRTVLRRQGGRVRQMSFMPDDPLLN